MLEGVLEGIVDGLPDVLGDFPFPLADFPFPFGDFGNFVVFRLRLCPIKARGSWALKAGMQSIESTNGMDLIRRNMVRSLGIAYRIHLLNSQ